MPYTTASQGAQANCAAVFMASLDTLLVAAGLSFVESVVLVNATANVYKSPAAGNSLGQDWYLVSSRSSDAATSLSFTVAEVWDTGTKKLRNYALAGATRTPTAQFAVNDAVGLSPHAGGGVLVTSVGLSLSGFQYWLSATPDRVVVGTRVGATDFGVYNGLYDDLLPVAISPFPLVTVRLLEGGGAGVGVGGATREPGATTSTTNSFGVNLMGTYQPQYAIASLYQATLVVGRSLLYTSRVGASGANGLRGALKHTVYLPVAGAVNGDTLAVTDSLGVVRNYVAVGATPVAHWADQAV